MLRWLGTCLLVALLFVEVQSEAGIYCGQKNCYDVLKLKEKATQAEVVNAYRKLAREWHPDKNLHRKSEAEKTFSEIAHAYDILRNEHSRREYDYALKHPERFAYNQARYYYRQYYTKHVKVNPFLVLIVSLIGWSTFDWFARSMSHAQAVRIYQQSPEYKMALKRLREETLMEMEKTGEVKKKLNGKRTRKEIDAVEVDEQILIDRIQVHGSYSKPQLLDLAIFQFWLLPWHLYKSLAWQVRWIVKYSINKEEYTDEDREYIVRGVLNMSKGTWDALDDKKRDRIMERELWVRENELKYRDQLRQAAIARAAEDFDSFD